MSEHGAPASPVPAGLAEPERLLYRRIAEGVRAAVSPAQALERAVDALGGAFGRYSWVGVYLVTGDELALGPWRGPAATAHVRIPIGQGVCGAAARSGTIENVPDVSQDPRYLACFTSTRSELVVPITRDTLVFGEIDVDSDLPAAFTPADERLLAAVAHLLLPAVQRLGGVGRPVPGEPGGVVARAGGNDGTPPAHSKLQGDHQWFKEV